MTDVSGSVRHSVQNATIQTTGVLLTDNDNEREFIQRVHTKNLNVSKRFERF